MIVEKFFLVIESYSEKFFLVIKSCTLKTIRNENFARRFERGTCEPGERVEKRVCFTSKHPFARIRTFVCLPLQQSLILSSFVSLSFLFVFRTGLAHVPASTTCVTRTIWRIRRRVASLSFPTPLEKRPPTNRTSPRVKTLNCTGRVGGVREGRVTNGPGVGKKIVQN